MKNRNNNSPHNIERLYDMDLRHFWHPYTSHDSLKAKSFPIFVRGEGPFLYDALGKKYIDGISSWWCVNLGHGHKELINAISSQASVLQNSMCGGASNDKVIALSEEISSITPAGLTRSFFASDGSSAVECALRIARQYWQNISKGRTKKKHFVALGGGYHGDTLGSISVGYSDVFHKELRDILPFSFFAQAPNCRFCPFGFSTDSCLAECFSDMENIISRNHESIIGVIVEPICQGAAGMKIYSHHYLRKLQSLCRKYGILLIVDEIAVGFYRTGHMFASNLAEIEPDIMVLGKAMTGGYLPMSAVVVTDDIYNSFDKGRTFFYGNTFAGNPILSNLALTAVKLYKEINVEFDLTPLCNMMKGFINACKVKFPDLLTSSCGMIGVLDFSNISAQGSFNTQNSGKQNGDRCATLLPQNSSDSGLLNLHQNSCASDANTLQSVLHKGLGDDLDEPLLGVANNYTTVVERALSNADAPLCANSPHANPCNVCSGANNYMRVPTKSPQENCTIHKDSCDGTPSAIASRVASISVEKGLFIRSLGPVVYLCPPINVDKSTLQTAFDILNSSLEYCFKAL